jgi:hypothetical protein
MASISVTRLRLRSIRFFPAFLWHSIRSQNQAKRAPGNRAMALRFHKGAFWTLTVWDTLEDTRAYMIAGAHREAMPRLLHWCDEASLAHWQDTADTLPSWDEAERRLATEGRLSKVKFPSSAQAEGKTLGS